jgi:ferredoxin-NADP reductase
VRRATPTTRILRLDLGGAKLDYAAGQLALLGIEGQSSRSPYSIASAPAETERHGQLEFLLRLESEHLARLRRGAHVSVEGPMGSFVLPERPEEHQLLFVAGGTGIAPIRSMIRQAAASRIDAALHLLYSARTPSDFAYLPELKRDVREGRLELALTATREVPPRWRGGRGRITREQLAPLVQSPETLCFVCGPASMVDEVPRILLDLGVDRRRIRIEEW